MKLYTEIMVLGSTRIHKEILRNMTYDFTMTSLPEQWENSDLRETRQIIYQSKGNDEGFENVIFIVIECLNKKLWPFKWDFCQF